MKTRNSFEEQLEPTALFITDFLSKKNFSKLVLKKINGVILLFFEKTWKEQKLILLVDRIFSEINNFILK
jgi:hypothetical protein